MQLDWLLGVCAVVAEALGVGNLGCPLLTSISLLGRFYLCEEIFHL